jgi:hypothetical protein
MARPNLKNALGREAVFSDQPTDPPPAHAERPRAVAGRSWEETHSRATYHLARDLQEAVSKEAASSGRSKSQVVADAIRQHLKLKG